MSSRNVLLVALDPFSEEQVRNAIEARQDDDVTLHVLAPASSIGPLQWLMGDEDEARAEAEDLADQTAHAVEGEVSVEEVETEVGDRDPLVAVEDALAAFPADEILLAGHADPRMEERIRRFGLPVERLDGAVDEGAGDAEEFARHVARGRTAATPLVVITSVGAVVLGAAALLSLLLFVVLWLV